MTTYDNLNIAQTTLTFQGVGNTSIASGIFDLSSLAFLPNIPLIDQIEVERIFDTGYDTKFSAYAFTIADRRQMFIFPKDWYTINEQTKVLTFKDLSTIPTQENNYLYYPNSRTFTLANGQTIVIPVVQANSSFINGVTRQADIVYIRRKTPSINSIVTFAPGTRLTTTQLNLQFDQLKYNIQELVAKFRNEAILKYDENAVDGPFLGQGDLKMNNNYIKDVNSPAFTLAGTTIADAITGFTFSANTFLVNLGTVTTGIINGTLHRTGLNSTPPTFTGDYNAGGLKLIQLANGSDAQDAATMNQITNASNLSTGSISPNVLASGSIPLGKLVSTTAGQGFTLPTDALPNANSLSATTSYGAASATNTNNMVYLTADVKGRITAINHRNLAASDLPNTAVTANTYGSANTKVPQITIDAQGRITLASDRTLGAADISSVNASAVSGALTSANLPSGVVTAGVTSIPTSITVDTYGRVTAVSSSGLTASNISDFNTAVQTSKLNQMAAPTAAVSLNNQKILLLSDPTISTDAANKNYIDTNFTSTANLNAAVRNNRLDQMTAPTASVSLNSQTITNLGTPINATDAATRGYVDTNYTSTTNLTAAIDSRLNTNSVFLTGGVLSAGTKKISNVVDPASDQDVVTRKYFTDNSIVSNGTNYSVGSKPIINLTMRAGASLEDNDAVNYGLVRAMSLFNQAVTDPQTFTNAWGSPGTAVTGNKPYVFSLSTLAATTGEMLVVTDSQNRTYVPTTTVPAAAGQFFLLNTSVSPKTVTVYLDSTITPTGTLTVRNFGTSRSVSAAIAGASTLGLVQVPTTGGLLIENGVGNLTLNAATTSQLGGIKIGTGLSIASGTNIVSVTSVAGNATLGQVMVDVVGTSGLSLNVSTGALSLPTATTTQLGGIKLGTTLSVSSGVVNVVFPTAGNSTLGQVMVDVVANSGLSLNTSTGALSLPIASTTQLGGVKIDTTAGLTNTSGLISVTRSDSTSSNSTTTLASSKAVNDLKLLSMLLDGTQTMTGKLKTFASTASVASLNVPSGIAVTTRTAGDIWNLSGSLQFSPDVTSTKTLAFTDSSITGTAATATALANGRTITLTGAVTGVSGSFNGAADLSFATTLAAGQAVTAVTGAGANAITATRTVDSVALTLPQNIGTASAVQFGSATLGNITLGVNTINTSTGNLILDSTGGTITINDNVGIAGTLTVSNGSATTLTGPVTLSSTLALSTAASTIALGGTASGALTSINSAGTATGVNAIGDIILRTPASGKAFLVRNATNTTVTAANDVIITEGELASRISGLSSIYMSSNGATRSTSGNQILGVATDTGSFIVNTGVTPTAKLTIANNGATSIANALTIGTGLTVSAGGIAVTGTSSIAGSLSITGSNLISANAVPTAGDHLTNKTYVDAQDLVAPFAYERTLAKIQRDRTVNTLGAISLSGNLTYTIDLSGLTIGVPTLVKFTTGTSTTVGVGQLGIDAGESAYLLFKDSSGGTLTTAIVPASLVGSSSYIVDVTTSSAPAAIVPVVPTLLSAVGNTALWNASSTNSQRAGFCILRVS